MPASRTSARRTGPGALRPLSRSYPPCTSSRSPSLSPPLCPPASHRGKHDFGPSVRGPGHRLAPNGGIAGVVFKRDGLRRAITGGTRLEGCSPVFADRHRTRIERRLGVQDEARGRRRQHVPPYRKAARSPHGRGIRWEIKSPPRRPLEHGHRNAAPIPGRRQDQVLEPLGRPAPGRVRQDGRGTGPGRPGPRPGRRGRRLVGPARPHGLYGRDPVVRRPGLPLRGPGSSPLSRQQAELFLHPVGDGPRVRPGSRNQPGPVARRTPTWNWP